MTMSHNDENPGQDVGTAPKQTQDRGGIHSFIRSLAISSQMLFSLAVIGTGLISVALFIYGFILSLAAIYHAIVEFSVEMHVVKEYLATSTQLIDIFLVATVFYIISLGLYELFIAKAPLPGWVKIESLDDLKTKLLSLTVIALAIIFLGAPLTLLGNTSILEFGAAVAMMIIAISVYLWVKQK